MHNFKGFWFLRFNDSERVAFLVPNEWYFWFLISVAQLTEAVEYTDCFSAEG